MRLVIERRGITQKRFIQFRVRIVNILGSSGATIAEKTDIYINLNMLKTAVLGLWKLHISNREVVENSEVER